MDESLLYCSSSVVHFSSHGISLRSPQRQFAVQPSVISTTMAEAAQAGAIASTG